MTDITVAAGGFPHYEGTTDVELWIVANKPFVTPDGKAISQSSVAEATWMIRKTLTVDVNKVLQIPQVVLDATADASVNPDATLSAYVVTPQGRPLSVLSVFRDFVVPATPTDTTWKDIALYQQAPDVPEDLMATAETFKNISLDLTVEVGATYTIYRGLSADALSLIASGVTAFPYLDDDLEPETEFFYRAKAVRGSKESGLSAAANATTPVMPATPAAPVLTLDVSSGQAHVTAPSVADATSYQLQRSVNGGAFASVGTYTAPATIDYASADLAEGDSVSFKAKAINQGVESAYSSTVADTIPVTPINPTTLGSAVHFWIRGYAVSNNNDAFPYPGPMDDQSASGGYDHDVVFASPAWPYFNKHGGPSNDTFGYWSFSSINGAVGTIQAGGVEANLSVRVAAFVVRVWETDITLDNLLPHLATTAGGTAITGTYRVNGVTALGSDTITADEWVLITVHTASPFVWDKIGYGGNLDFDLAMAFGVAPDQTTETIAGLEAWSMVHHSLPDNFVMPTATGAGAPQMLMAGDSRSTAAYPYKSDLQADYPTYGVTNYAVNGDTAIGQMTNLMTTGFPTRDATKSKHIVIAWMGTNDVNGGSSGGRKGTDVAFAHAFGAYHAKRNGWTWISATESHRAWTGTPADPADVNTQIDNANAAILSKVPTYGGQVASFHTDPALDDPSDASYFLDGVHLTATGAHAAADVMSSKIATAPAV